jgi:hypothetical protein
MTMIKIQKGLEKDGKEIRKVVDWDGCHYFEHCYKEKLKSISRWFKYILHNKDIQCTLQKKNPEEYEESSVHDSIIWRCSTSPLVILQE